VSPGAPSAPVSYVPSPTAPITYQSIVPKISYQDQANYLKATTNQLNTALQAMYQQTGTPAESGARQAGYRMQEAASYAASLPKGDRWIKETTGNQDPYGAARNAAMQQASVNQREYINKLRKAKTTPGYQVPYETPSWSTHEDTDWAVKTT